MLAGDAAGRSQPLSAREALHPQGWPVALESTDGIGDPRQNRDFAVQRGPGRRHHRAEGRRRSSGPKGAVFAAGPRQHSPAHFLEGHAVGLSGLQPNLGDRRWPRAPRPSHRQNRLRAALDRGGRRSRAPARPGDHSHRQSRPQPPRVQAPSQRRAGLAQRHQAPHP